MNRILSDFHVVHCSVSGLLAADVIATSYWTGKGSIPDSFSNCVSVRDVAWGETYQTLLKKKKSKSNSKPQVPSCKSTKMSLLLVKKKCQFITASLWEPVCFSYLYSSSCLFPCLKCILPPSSGTHVKFHNYSQQLLTEATSLSQIPRLPLKNAILWDLLHDEKL